MSLELIKESIRINKIVEDGGVQRIIDNDIIVPDSKPDISRILLLDGEILAPSINNVQARVYLTGKINYRILYISDENETNVCAINTTIDFSKELDDMNMTERMRYEVKGDIEHIDFEIINGRKINLKAVSEFRIKVTEEVLQDIVTDLKTAEDIEVLKKAASISCYLGRNEDLLNLEESFEITTGKPPIFELLRDDVKVILEDEKISDNKIIAKGKVCASLLYKAEDEERSLQYVEYEVPFSRAIDLEGIDQEGCCEADYTVERAVFECVEDSDGENRLIDARIDIRISVLGFKQRAIACIEDVYGMRSSFNIEKDKINLIEIVRNVSSQFNIKDNLNVIEDDSDIIEVYNVLAKPILTEYKIENGKMFIEGIVNNRVLYLSNREEASLSCFEKEIPFRHSFDVELGDIENGICEAGLDIDNFSYSMTSGKNVEVRAVLCARAKISKNNEVVFTDKIEEASFEEEGGISNLPSIVVYFAQAGDSLWKVAKRYRVRVDDILKMNNLEESVDISVGQQIIVPIL